ncbi:UDP-galactose/UDP-glucose transporter 7-like [Hibiscus syriacus]|uniref:UDP-galactose/UDP-glucose transporter 7-like n=1 Tax=Hibiscus syriacus TaxID=106335 RepID=UPI0019227989|nr:UDP-galactose/UDP-glucose transporter 7-like [Hibiscus syriacus]
MALTSVFFPECFFQTMYLVLVEKSGAEEGLSSIETMFYNSFLSLPFLLFLIIATGEFPNSLALLLAKSNSFSFLCTIVNYALTTTVVGVLKGVGSTTLGFVLLGGGVWYSYAKYQQRNIKAVKVMSDLESHRKNLFAGEIQIVLTPDVIGFGFAKGAIQSSIFITSSVTGAVIFPRLLACNM